MPSFSLYDKLFVKVIATSIEDSIVAKLYHLRVNRKKEKYIHKKEQETVVKKCFVGNRTVRINRAIWIYVVCLQHKFSTFNSAENCGTRGVIVKCDFLVDIRAHVFFIRCI